MEWLNIRVSMLRAPEYIGSNPTERATWLNVLGYCVEQENGGRIKGGAAWKDRQWQQACGVTMREVRGASKLININGEDITLWAFPSEKQQAVQKMRALGSVVSTAKSEASKANGKSGGRPKNNPTENLTENPTENLENNPTETYRRGKGIGIGREGEGEKEEPNPTPNPELLRNQDPDDADDAHIPTVKEVISAGALAGVPKDYCERFHARTDEQRKWLSGGRLVKWRRQLVRFWGEDGPGWVSKSGSRPAPAGLPKAAAPFRDYVAEADAAWEKRAAAMPPTAPDWNPLRSDA